MKRLLSTLLALTMALALVSCGKSNPTPNTGSNKTETPSETADTKTEGNVHIGIVTGSVSQSEDDRRGAEAFQALYGEDMVKLAIYPDNFTEELETTIQTIVNLADDADMKAIIVNQSVPGTTEAFRKIKEIRPDILCIAGEAHEDLLEIGSAADLVCNNDFVARGYLIIRTAHELGCDTFVHISFPRHLAYETMSRRIAVMKAACEEFGMKFVMETAPDPTSDVGVAGAQAYILEKVPEWSKTYGEKAAYFGTNDLTQMTFGFSRDDAGKFLPSYYDNKIYESDPFARLDQVGVGKLVDMACKLGRATRPDIHLGICGEHGGDPSSVEFCHKVGLDYVSCSPFRVPIARLAAAQAAIKDAK